MSIVRASVCQLIAVGSALAFLGCGGVASPSASEGAGTGGSPNAGASGSKGDAGGAGSAGLSGCTHAEAEPQPARTFCSLDTHCSETEFCDLASCFASSCFCAQDGTLVCTSDCGHVCTPRPSGGTGAAQDGTQVFTDESEAIEIGWFSFWTGGYRFHKRRDQLSEQQLRLVQEIRTIPSREECWADVAGASVTITDAGKRREYRANEHDGTCGTDATMVGYDAVSAFLATARCLSAKGYDASALDSAPTVAADDGCFHGLFSGSGATPAWWFRVDISTAGEHRVAIDRCWDRDLRLTFLDPTGVDELATSDGNADAECPSLTHRFDEPGNYVLKIEMDAGNSAGDFYVRVDTTGK